MSDETSDITKQPFLLDIVCIGTIPQHQNHNLIIPNHSGRHAKIEPIPFFVALLFLFLLVLSSQFKGKCRLCKGECVCACVCCTPLLLQNSLQIPHLKEIGSENMARTRECKK